MTKRGHQPECYGLMNEYYSVLCDSDCLFTKMCVYITLKESDQDDKPKEENTQEP